MIEKMFRTTLRANTARSLMATAVLISSALLAGCGTSTSGPNGSKHQTMNGVSESGYPGGKPVDSQSPALSSSSEQDHSTVRPKVPVESVAVKTSKK